jgi:hypothetical protein
MQPQDSQLVPPIPECLRWADQEAALEQLLEAYDLAGAGSQEPWQSGLRLDQLEDAGLNINRLRLLLCQQFLLQAIESPPESGQPRNYRMVAGLQVSVASCFVLTDQGADWARSMLRQGLGSDSARKRPTQKPNAFQLTPRWLAGPRELWLGIYVIKKFRRPADNQTALLAAFERQGWPRWLPNPFTSDLDCEAVQRLHDAIKFLNRGQEPRLIVFRGDGTGQGTSWHFAD